MGEKIQVIEGKNLVCPLCKNDEFEKRRTKLNTTGMTLMRMDWANKSAMNYICTNCGYIFWVLH